MPSFWAVEIAVEGGSLAEEEKAEDLRMVEVDEEAIFLLFFLFLGGCNW